MPRLLDPMGVQLRTVRSSIRRRSAWIGGAIILAILGFAVVGVGLDRTFLQVLIATFIGAALGFLVALFVDRHQRAEAAEAQRDRDAAAADLRRRRDNAAADTQRQLNAEAEQRARDREAAAAKARQLLVLTLLRDELGRIPKQMGGRQERAYPPPDRLVDVFWRSLSASGELRWIDDLDLLRTVATAYDHVAVEVALEAKWMEARSLAGSGVAASENYIGNALRSEDGFTWRAVCAAYKAIDSALVADGVGAGPDVFCP